MLIIYKLLFNKTYFFSYQVCRIGAEIIPRFDMRDKDGIIFDPIVPRAGEMMLAKCTVVQLTPENRKSVSWRLQRQNDGKVFYLATNNDVFQFKNPIQRLFAHHELNSNDWYLEFNPLDRDDIGNLTCYLADTGGEEVSLTRYSGASGSILCVFNI